MKYVAISGAIAMLWASSNLAHAANIQITAQNPVVELSISERVDSRPDMATFSTGVESKAPTATQALRENSIKAKQVIDKLKSLGIAEKDIQTTGINLNADYQYDRKNETNRFVGYRVSNQVQVTIRNIDKLGTILDALVSTGGATNLSGPYFSVDNDSAVRKLARERALANGKKLAENYAQASGFSGVRVLSIAEGTSSVSPGPMPAPPPTMAVRNESVPIAPGQVGTSVTLNISYEMTR